MRIILLEYCSIASDIVAYFVKNANDNESIIACLQAIKSLTFVDSSLLRNLRHEVCVVNKAVSLLELAEKTKPDCTKELLIFFNNYFYEKNVFEDHQMFNRILRQLLRCIVVDVELVISIIYNYCGNQTVIVVENDFAMFNVIIQIFMLSPQLDDDTKQFCWFIINSRSEQTKMPQNDLIKAFYYIIISKFFASEIESFNTSLLKLLHFATQKGKFFLKFD